MSDLISRQYLLEEFNLSEKTRKHGSDKSGYETLMKYEIQDIIEDAPDVYVGEWTPVSEMPPKYPCLACDAHGNPPSIPMGILTLGDKEHGTWYLDGKFLDWTIGNKRKGDMVLWENRIVAWMPLPQPYRQEGAGV